jgi:hypothetical protein
MHHLAIDEGRSALGLVGHSRFARIANWRLKKWFFETNASMLQQPDTQRMRLRGFSKPSCFFLHNILPSPTCNPRPSIHVSSDNTLFTTHSTGSHQRGSKFALDPPPTQAKILSVSRSTIIRINATSLRTDAALERRTFCSTHCPPQRGSMMYDG